MEIIYEKSGVKNYMKEDAIDTTFVVAKRKPEEIQVCTRFEPLKENIFELDTASTDKFPPTLIFLWIRL